MGDQFERSKQNQLLLENNRHKDSNKLNKFSKPEYLQFKLADLIDANSSFVIDNLYAQFQSNSKQINLFYLPPMEKRLPENSLLLSTELLFHINNDNNNKNNISQNGNNSVNMLLNDFYLLAAKHQLNNSKF